MKQLALEFLQWGANHISANVLLRQETVDFLSRSKHYRCRDPDLHGFIGQDYISFMMISAEIVLEQGCIDRDILHG